MIECDHSGVGTRAYRARGHATHVVHAQTAKSNMLLKITLPLMHVNVSPRTESGWTRKNTDCCKQVRANTDDRASSGTPSKRRKISTSETSPVGVATKTAQVFYSCILPLSGHVWSMRARFGILIIILKDVEKLENVQKFALRLCVKQWDLDYTSLLFICDLPTLAARRQYFSLCTMYKIVNNLMDFPSDVFIPRVTSRHSASNHLYLQTFSRTNSYLFSFVPNTCSDWNKLPLCLKSTESLALFKSSLRDWLHI